MSSSELRYLIAIDELSGRLKEIKQMDLANKLHVSKVSVYNAVEKLKEKGFIEKNERKLLLTKNGEQVLEEYMVIIRFMAGHLSLHCAAREKQAYEDALNATCAFSDATRNGIVRFIKSKMESDRRE